MTTTYTTKLAQYPGQGVLDSEFFAVATPEQAALYHATPRGTWASVDARRGTWSFFDGTRDVLWFYRSTGEVEAAS